MTSTTSTFRAICNTMDDASTLLPLLGLLRAVKAKQRRKSRSIPIPSRRLNLKRETDTICEFNYRFRKVEIFELVQLLKMPSPFPTTRGYNVSAVEALCVLLNRLAWPHRLGTMVQHFGRSREALSSIFNAVLDHVHTQFAHLLKWDEGRLDGAWMEACARVIHSKGAPLDSCIGFIDGTVRGICRPKHAVQRAAYNGHKVSISSMDPYAGFVLISI